MSSVTYFCCYHNVRHSNSDGRPCKRSSCTYKQKSSKGEKHFVCRAGRDAKNMVPPSLPTSETSYNDQGQHVNDEIDQKTSCFVGHKRSSPVDINPENVKKRKVRCEATFPTEYLAHCAKCGKCARKDKKLPYNRRLFRTNGREIPGGMKCRFIEKKVWRTRCKAGHKATDGENNKLCNACYLQYKEQKTQKLTETTVVNEPLHTSKKHENTPNYVIWPVSDLEKLILNDSHCPSCKGKSKTCAVLSKGETITFKLACASCNFCWEHSNSPGPNVFCSGDSSGYSQLNVAIIWSTIMSGGTYTTYLRSHISNPFSTGTISSKEWHKIEEALEPIVKKLINESYTFLENMIFIVACGDGGYATKRNSSAASYALLEYWSKKVICQVTLQKDRTREKDGKTVLMFKGNHNATSQSMEVAGLIGCVDNISQDCLDKLGIVVSDRDCKIGLYMKEDPRLQHLEHLYDQGHILNNMKPDLHKIFGKGQRYGGFVNRILNWWMKCVKESIHSVAQVIKLPEVSSIEEFRVAQLKIKDEFSQRWCFTSTHYSTRICGSDCPCYVEDYDPVVTVGPEDIQRCRNNIWLSLPDEILLKILDYASFSRKDYDSITLSCKRFYLVCASPELKRFHFRKKTDDRPFLNKEDPKDNEKLLLLQQFQEEIHQKWMWFCHWFETCAVENLWSRRIRFADKSRCFWRFFQLRALLPVGIINYGSQEEFEEKLFQEIGLERSFYSRLLSSRWKKAKLHLSKRSKSLEQKQKNRKQALRKAAIRKQEKINSKNNKLLRQSSYSSAKGFAKKKEPQLVLSEELLQEISAKNIQNTKIVEIKKYASAVGLYQSKNKIKVPTEELKKRLQVYVQQKGVLTDKQVFWLRPNAPKPPVTFSQ